MQVSPLLSNEISGFEVNDEAHNANYTKELSNLFNEIIDDLQKADVTGTGRVTEEELLDYLQKKLPPGRQLNIPLFKQLFQDVDRNIDMNIDLNDFCKKYIQAHEELKLNFETLKKGFDKEKSLKTELETKIQTVKQEQLNKNGVSPDACVSTEIGKVTLLSQINSSQIYFQVKIDDREEKKTATKNIDNSTFLEKFTFPIEDKQSILSYKLFGVNNNDSICEIDVPLYIINLENEEVTPEFELKDANGTTVAVFRPKIIVVTSYYDMYQKQYDNIDKNIESYQSRINQLSETLNDISLPYKKEFDQSAVRILKGPNSGINNNDQLVNGVEGILKHAFVDKKVKWILTLKIILYFCIICLLFSFMLKPDFVSLFLFIVLLIVINTGKTNYLFLHFNKILIGILVVIFYDVFDYLFLRKITIESMSAVEGWANFFGFLEFLGKTVLLLACFIVKVKFEKTGVISE